MVSFIGGAGSTMPMDSYSSSWRLKRLDRDVVLLDPVMFKKATLEGRWQAALKPIFDSLWNAFGYERCSALFDANGQWLGFPRGWR